MRRVVLEMPRIAAASDRFPFVWFNTKSNKCVSTSSMTRPCRSVGCSFSMSLKYCLSDFLIYFPNGFLLFPTGCQTPIAKSHKFGGTTAGRILTYCIAWAPDRLSATDQIFVRSRQIKKTLYAQITLNPRFYCNVLQPVQNDLNAKV